MSITPTQKPKLSFWQIWNMSFGFLGIQFGFALQNANTSRIFELLGAEVEDIPILWIAAPVTGLLVQPIIGHMSDKTWNRLGRRRPYFLIGAILSSIALFIMPNSPTLWVAAGMLWIMDASINISMEPFRAFVGDMLPPNQRNMGFAMQSFFIGMGAVIASALPYLLSEYFGMSSEGDGVTDSVKWSFYIGGSIFLIAVLWTVFRTKEYPPEVLEAYEAHEAAEAAKTGTTAAYDSTPRSAQKFIRGSFFWILIGVVTTALVYFLKGDKQLYILTCGLGAFGIFQIIAGLLSKEGKKPSGFVEVMSDLFKMPKTMKQLAVVQFFSWFALFSLWIYSSNAVSTHHFDMKLDQGTLQGLEVALQSATITGEEALNKKADILADLAVYRTQDGPTTVKVELANYFLQEGSTVAVSPEVHAEISRVKAQFDEGGDWVGVLFAWYNGFAALVAFLLPLLAKRINRRRTHLLALVAGGIGLCSVYVIPNPNLLILSMLGVGIAWASILSMPYAMLTNSIPTHKMGVFMGIFNFFIVIPQLTAATVLGSLVKMFNDQSIYALLIGGAAMVIAGLLTLQVQDKE